MAAFNGKNMRLFDRSLLYGTVLRKFRHSIEIGKVNRTLQTGILKVADRSVCSQSWSSPPRSLCITLPRRYLCSTPERKEDGNKAAQQSCSEKRENIFTVPNLLTSARIVVSPYIGYLIVGGSYTPALIWFLLCAATDSIDGYIARKFPSQQSVLGSVIDPLGDKLMVGIVAVCLTYTGILPWQLVTVILLKDIGLVLSSVAVRFMTLDPPRTAQRFFDVTHATVEFKPNTLGKLTTFLQILTISSGLAAPVFSFVDHPALVGLWWLTGAATVGSFISYLGGSGFKELRKR